MFGPCPPLSLSDLMVFSRGGWYSLLWSGRANWLRSCTSGYSDPEISVHIYINNTILNFCPFSVNIKVLKGIAPSWVETISSVFYKFTLRHYLKSTSSFWRVRVCGVERGKKWACLKFISHVSLAIHHAITFILHKLVVILLGYSGLLTDITIYLTFYNDFDSAHTHLTISIWILRKYYIAFCRPI